jgi:orotate phosphoribosyltransferase
VPDNAALDLLRKTEAVLDGHFVGTSGRHIPTYINKDALYPHTAETSQMGELLAKANQHLDVDVVVGPSVGGIILSTWTAYHLSKLKGREVLSVYTEKNESSEQIFKRGYDKLVAGKKVLLVEDLTTTGGSIKSVVSSVRAAGGEVANVCVMVNKDTKRVTTESMGAPFSSLAVLETPSYEAEECPLCRDGVPVNTEVGHGKKFLAAKGAAK